MNKQAFIGFVSLATLVLAACQTTDSGSTSPAQSSAKSSSFTRISDASVFQSKIVGKTLKNASMESRITGDKKWGGHYEGEPMGGAWNWKNGYWCRTGQAAGQALSNDCQLVEIKGNSVRFSRDKGKGSKTTLTISN